LGGFFYGIKKVVFYRKSSLFNQQIANLYMNKQAYNKKSHRVILGG